MLYCRRTLIIYFMQAIFKRVSFFAFLLHIYTAHVNDKILHISGITPWSIFQNIFNRYLLESSQFIKADIIRSAQLYLFCIIQCLYAFQNHINLFTGFFVIHFLPPFFANAFLTAILLPFGIGILYINLFAYPDASSTYLSTMLLSASMYSS